MIDRQGFRPNIGIILINNEGKVFWAKRLGQDAWQFPQGGVQSDETPEQALYRELWEEVGLRSDDVNVVASTRRWLRYRLPRRYIRFHQKPVCIGQKQKWYLLQLIGNDTKINLSSVDVPEFDDWRWANYWDPLKEVIAFKKRVYSKALKELLPFQKRAIAQLSQ